jgi:hypothetical protein
MPNKNKLMEKYGNELNKIKGVRSKGQAKIAVSLGAVVSF